MKLFVEISEKDIQIKLDEAIGARVSQLTDDYINKKISDVIDKKLERLHVDKILKETIRECIISSHGEPARYNSSYAQILREEACKILNEQFKANGVMS